MEIARVRRINSLIKDQLSQLILHECDWARLTVISITKVDTSPDLENCDVYVSMLAEGQEQKDYFQRLKNEVRHLRYELAQKIELRKVPFLRFHLDDSIEVAERVIKLLEQV